MIIKAAGAVCKTGYDSKRNKRNGGKEKEA